MQDKTKIIDSLYERNFLDDSEEIVLSDGFDDALIGVTCSNPKVAIYDFWKGIDCIMKSDNDVSFDEALDWLEDFAQLKMEENELLTPIFVKTL